MQNTPEKKRYGWVTTAAFVIWFIINIRVAIGVGSTFERAVDGLVGIALLFAAVFLALDFFQLIGKEEGKSG